ncbi:ApeA N-terminal domain 1-containing protein [Frigoriglobus tundricola]|uniref:ApeA N-terminal domain-containing protein n=1 Tax=Frigoriglobus tundricola TaxID=2774151 RepID=A0A6M5YK66_9BACT|nr:hypothetical protein [Frigoriglobus tundricola]QJW93730.1 hypothetical protein FTUN_1241 [Frigoriglobus tundricola]
MEPFEIQGHWWTPNRPERCPGTLRCNEAGELHLHLFGAIVDSDRAVGNSFDIVYGEVVKLAGVKRTAPKGDFVTLLHSFVSSEHLNSSGTHTQTLFANRAFFGDTLLPSDAEWITRANLRISGLAGWASEVTGITRGAGSLFSKSWVRPEPIRIGFPKGELLLGAAVSAPSRARQWSLEESLGFSLTYHSPVTDSQLSKDAWVLQNFLTFATDRPNALTRLEVDRDGDEGMIPMTILGPAVFDDASAAEGVTPHELLFGYAAVSNRFEDVIRCWFDLSDKHPGAFAIYFGLKYNPPRYSDLRFQLMGQALSLYYTDNNARGTVHRSTNISSDSLTTSLDPLVRDELARTHPLLVLTSALRTFTGRFAVVFDPLIRAHDDNSRRPFLQMATRTFQYVIGREYGAPDEPKGTTYHWLTELLGFLWKIAILNDLGFTTEEQQKLLAQNRMYQHIRDQIALGFFDPARLKP